jgi:uncharacterized protein with gpF-like domain
MPTRDENEQSLFQVVERSLRSWLEKAKASVMKPFQQFHVMPTPTGVSQVQGAWNSEVDTILTKIGQISMAAWSEASDVPPVSRHAFVMASLAKTRNYLVHIPDEVYHLIFAEITDGLNAGETVDQIAHRVDLVLDWSGSQNWPNRARTIAQTETTRAYGVGTLAAGMEQSRVSGKALGKRWDTEHDPRVRETHRAVDGQVQDLGTPFDVGGFPMMMPGDPIAPADEVCGCRCRIAIVDRKVT